MTKRIEVFKPVIANVQCGGGSKAFSAKSTGILECDYIKISASA